jgi:hypothetical protein
LSAGNLKRFDWSICVAFQQTSLNFVFLTESEPLIFHFGTKATSFYTAVKNPRIWVAVEIAESFSGVDVAALKGLSTSRLLILFICSLASFETTIHHDIKNSIYQFSSSTSARSNSSCRGVVAKPKDFWFTTIDSKEIIRHITEYGAIITVAVVITNYQSYYVTIYQQ